jgi:Ser/Thr protein kinase RdoA (MazF antagonist)
VGVAAASGAPRVTDDAVVDAQLGFDEHLAGIDPWAAHTELDETPIGGRRPQGVESGDQLVRRAMCHACHRGRLMAGSRHAFPDRNDLWLDDGVVVRRHDHVARGTVEWIHRFLAQLTFDAPRPVPYFDGVSVAVVDGVVWSALSYVEGETVGWSPAPSMFELGAFLATFHAAAKGVEMDVQQSPAFPVDVDVVGRRDRPRHVIHGDPTNHNVLAAGSPPRPCGIIDFGNAFIGMPLFDIGCALWRSGRPSQDVHEFDPDRIAEYVEGYSSVDPLSDDDRVDVVACLRARGAQIITKQAARGVTDEGPRRKLDWLARHQDLLVSVLIP